MRAAPRARGGPRPSAFGLRWTGSLLSQRRGSRAAIGPYGLRDYWDFIGAVVERRAVHVAHATEGGDVIEVPGLRLVLGRLPTRGRGGDVAVLRCQMRDGSRRR